MKPIIATFILIYIFTAIFGVLVGIEFQEKRHPVNIPQPLQIHAITMPQNCYDQLKNADMIHIKILEEK